LVNNLPVNKPIIEVAAAIVVRVGLIMAARKAIGKPHAGEWEFPGGKREIDESYQQCLHRELQEELGVSARIGSEFGVNKHEYVDKIVELHAYWAEFEGTPKLTDHDQIRWLKPEMLMSLTWAKADIPFVEQLQNTELTKLG